MVSTASDASDETVEAIVDRTEAPARLVESVSTTSSSSTSPPATVRSTTTPTTTPPVTAPPTTAPPATTPSATAPPARADVAPGDECHPAYTGCLAIGAGDYDCASGSGNGPNYTGRVELLGSSDPFDLDRDGNGIGCDNG
ncbi:MAG: hypothetical protein AAGA17_08905 [Actinomycetota bacterium]